MKIVSAENKIVDKLVEESIKNVEEVKLTKIASSKDENKHKNKCSFLHTVHYVILNNSYN